MLGRFLGSGDIGEVVANVGSVEELVGNSVEVGLVVLTRSTSGVSPLPRGSVRVGVGAVNE